MQERDFPLITRADPVDNDMTVFAIEITLSELRTYIIKYEATDDICIL